VWFSSALAKVANENHTKLSSGIGVISERAERCLDQSQVDEIVKVAAIRAGVEVYEREVERGPRAGEKEIRSRVSPHWLRHASASHSIDRGESLPVVRDTLGQSSIAVTDVYSHARPGQGSTLRLPL
jgi:integrase/recombinase XerD